MLERVLLASLLALAAPSGEADRPLTEQMATTRCVNLDAVLLDQFPSSLPGANRRLVNPYLEENLKRVRTRQAQASGSVCALAFVDAEARRYELKTFGTAAEALASGHVVTHQGRCGACSTLRDLAVYLERPNLTAPARQCARKWGFQRIKRCFMEQVGFTEACAEAWAYNARNTRRSCRGPCVETYGLLNLLLHRYPAANNRADGSLNACLQCDEDISGPGFRYSAGRTRRNSGIASAIERPEEALFPVDHAAYFRD